VDLLRRESRRLTFLKKTLIKSKLARQEALKARPSVAEAACVAGSGGMAEAMPFQGSPLNDLIEAL